MIIDLTVTNFRSFQSEQMFSMNVETARDRHPGNFAEIEDGKLAVLRTAAILGANASGKSNILSAFRALQWMVLESASRKEGQRIPPYEPYRLSKANIEAPVRLEIEFVVPSGIRYRYEIAYLSDRIVEERLSSFARRQRALIFERGADDNWETIKFGGTYKGGHRRLPFFQNVAYLSRAGNDASAPEAIREIRRYFERWSLIVPGQMIVMPRYLDDPEHMRTVSELICLADTGIATVRREVREDTSNLRFPSDMPDAVKEVLIEKNSVDYKFSIKSDDGEMIDFDQDEMSDGTIKLLETLPLIIDSLKNGSVTFFDELDANLHTDLLSLILQIYNDPIVNAKNAQLIFTTHDTNVLDSNILRRDQIWFVSKSSGSSSVKSLDEYEKNRVRHDSPFEAFYRDGRLGAVPKFSYARVREVILASIEAGEANA
ncbi:ATP-binding protein [Sphingobium sp. AR-3-1]|uniref:ATP-binding protein n=1 Tax=Sphingobium psychrophilum TaxID=2728834 RepID=A0A7X9ZUQ8_9SPHN|nr:ATP-binding protein [Sphingobium psychrophilum]NML13238.1 ATP-binding protein [Sphingobium psychrophilum]